MQRGAEDLRVGGIRPIRIRIVRAGIVKHAISGGDARHQLVRAAVAVHVFIVSFQAHLRLV